MCKSYPIYLCHVFLVLSVLIRNNFCTDKSMVDIRREEEWDEVEEGKGVT